MAEQESIVYRLRGDKVIWTVVIMLSLISIAAVYSSSSSLAYKNDVSSVHFLLTQMRFVLFGLTALYVCYRIPLRVYRSLAYPGMILSAGLLLATAIAGKSVNEADRWINIFGISFQPSELAKIAVVLYIAKVMELYPMEKFMEFFLRILLPVGLISVLILNGSTSQALLMGSTVFLIIMVSSTSWKHIFKSIGLVAAAAAILILLHLAFGILPRLDTAYNRFKFNDSEQLVDKNLSPAEKQKILDKTHQKRMAKVAIASVGILGKGPGNSTQRYLLPHPYSDFIYTIIIEEWGFMGGALVLMLYLFFLYRCLMLARLCTKPFTMLVVTGLGLMITLQALLHMLVNVAIIPVTGHTLPLISLGGTSLIIISGSFGIILSVSRTIEIGRRKKRENEAEENRIENNNTVEVIEL
ncbi:MAG: FtsW/RodA/SpoVE family cell cycle protein [Bacteroidales bacterium]|nr:FtsW/RodA/SpoVE family cell cycle protein [Bacteroidales bacterium]MDD2424574.1 FtsW/RodA/SpoVE family cell cycle protein [Bacteroidales bacterium]MDD3988752.1 FtsW/RodA/SpoVE family cell cycle protein [Bacteroidales bacterium]MDD4639587.1 FtsW/RodA/SpoVE family cell cycle protein [Bacteroidales bacterium]